MIAHGGTCRTCGQPAVQIEGERTYHPASTYLHQCGAALPIGATGYYSFDLPEDQFVRKPVEADTGQVS